MPQVDETCMKGKEVLICLGSNATSSADEVVGIIEGALECIAARFEQVPEISAFYRTPCFPEGAGPDFVNAACRIETGLRPARILAILHEIEADFGRIRQKRWGQRSLDLDLIAVGNAVLPDAATYTRWLELPLEAQMTQAPEALILPHPRLQDRAFVLRPLSDVAPDWRHPVLGMTVAQMLAERPSAERTEIKAL